MSSRLSDGNSKPGEAWIAWQEARARRARRRRAGLNRFGRPTKRALGTNPRALATNPRAVGTNPRALRLVVDDVMRDERTLDSVQLGRRLGWAA